MGDEAVIQTGKPRNAPRKHGAPKRGAILLADGDRNDVFLTMRAFEKAGVRNDVVVFRDGLETLERILENGEAEVPELVMLALNLSRLSGVDVLRRMRANEATRHLPAILLISSEEQREVLVNYGLKADGYVCKPVDFLQLRYETGALDFEWMVENDS